MVKNLPAMYEFQVRSLGLEDHLEKGMATHSSILAWRTPWTEEPGGLQSTRLQRVGHNRSKVEKQKSVDRRAIVHRVTKSRTHLSDQACTQEHMSSPKLQGHGQGRGERSCSVLSDSFRPRRL